MKQRFLLLVLCLLVFLLVGMGAFGRTGNVKATNTTPAPSFDMMMQLNIYSIDLKTETLYSQYYSFQMYTSDPTLQSFTVVILQPDYDQAVGMQSWNVSGHQQVNEEISTDPQKVTVPWQWHLNPIRPAVLSTPFDHYELSFLIAVNMSTDLTFNEGTVFMPLYLRGDWVWSADIAAEKLAAVPSNQTLTSLGLSPEKFYQWRCNDMSDFYLFTVALSFPFMSSLRTTIAFFLPSVAILIVLLVATVKRKILKRADVLTIFVGAGLFTLSFLVSFYQYAPPDVFTWQEVFLIVDFAFAASLAVYSLVRRDELESDNSDKTQTQKPKTENEKKILKSSEIKLSEEAEKRIEKLDKVFDTVIILASIISATLFQFVSSAPRPQDSAMYERLLTALFRLFLVPLVLTIAMWIPTQLARRNTLRTLLLRKCAWACSLETLGTYLLFVIVLGFGGTVNILLLAIVSLFICVIVGGVLLYYVLVEYQEAFDPEFLKTKEWLYRQAPVIAVGLILVELSLLLSIL